MEGSEWTQQSNNNKYKSVTVQPTSLAPVNSGITRSDWVTTQYKNKTSLQFSFWSISPPYLLEWLTDCGHRWHRTCHWCLSNLCFYHLADWTFSSGKNKSCSHCSKDTIGPGPISPRNLCKSWRRTLISDPAGLSRFRAHCNPHNLTFLHPGPQSEEPNLPENSHPGTFRAASVSLQAAKDPWTLTEKLTDNKTDHRLPSLC